jgi:hypothetical protein
VKANKIHWRKGPAIGALTGCGLTTDKNFNVGNPNATYVVELAESDDPRKFGAVCHRCAKSARNNLKMKEITMETTTITVTNEDRANCQILANDLRPPASAPPRPLQLYPEERTALERGASIVLITDRPGMIPPKAGEQLLGYVGEPSEGVILDVLGARLTTIGDLTEEEKDAAKASEERFVLWFMRMMGSLPWSPDTKVYATAVAARK